MRGRRGAAQTDHSDTVQGRYGQFAIALVGARITTPIGCVTVNMIMKCNAIRGITTLSYSIESSYHDIAKE